MAYYSQYQAQPGWGSQQYALAAPPAPTYQPQPSWRGADYYSAHYGQPDNSLFDYVWARVRGAFVGIGIGKEEAKYWHRRVYGGLVDIPGMEPRNVGAAAGYEALRIWQYHKAVYRQPLSDDHEREREALAGLAVGEASKLWQYTGRFSDKYGRREACEVAAATAQRVFNERYDYDSYNAYEGAYSTRSRRNSFVGGMEEEPYDDGYGGGGGGGYRRQRRLSTSSGYERDYEYPARPSSAMGYGGSAVGYSGGSAVGYSPGPVGYAGSAVGYSGGAVGYPGSAVGMAPALATPYMGGQAMQAVTPYATASSAYGAPQTAYGAYPGGAGMYGQQQQMMLAGGQYPQQSLYGVQQPGYAPGLGSSYGGGVDAYGRPRSNSLYYPGY